MFNRIDLIFLNLCLNRGIEFQAFLNVNNIIGAINDDGSIKIMSVNLMFKK